MPKQVGSAVSIVGALVIGQASVQAGLVSAPMVIVVAITGIASFMMPSLYCRNCFPDAACFPMIAALPVLLGLLGIMMGITRHSHSLMQLLRSFCVPYLAPLAPLKGKKS